MNKLYQPSELKRAARQGVMAANYYGFACDCCLLKGKGRKTWYDTKTQETHFIRSFSNDGSEIRLCLNCSKQLQKTCLCFSGL